MNTRIAVFFFAIAFSEEGIGQNSDPGYVGPHTEREWERIYAEDDPNLTEQQRQAARNSVEPLPDPGRTDLVALVARTKPSVVQIDVVTGGGVDTGTGFFISRDGYCVTAAHVFARALKGTPASPFAHGLVATANDGTHYFAQRIAYLNKTADIAIVKFDCQDVAYLDPDATGDLEEGQTVLVIGSPEGLAGTISTGIVAAIREDSIQISAPISPGSSGSPVLNEDGYVVGVAVGMLEEGQNLNFAISVIEIFKGMEAVSALHAREYELIANLKSR
jgi:S1-C subfamily serine protease